MTRAPHVSVLMYHDVDGPGGTSGFDDRGSAVYAVSEERFGAQLDLIAARAPTPPLTAADLLAGPPPGGWAVTFDDGGASALHAAHELEARGWRGHFLVPTDYLGRPGFLDGDGVRALAHAGHTVGSHSCSHPPRISALSEAELRREWSESVAALTEATGIPVTVGSVPGGFYSPLVGRAAAAAGLRVLFTSEPTRAVAAIDGCLLVGRYAVRASSRDGDVAAAAAGAARPWLAQRLAWSGRAVAKRIAGPGYERVRARLLERRTGQR